MKNEFTTKSFLTFTIRVIIIHTITYFTFGIIFGYFKTHSMYSLENMNLFFRPLSDPLVMFGTLIQILRGFIIAVGLYPFRNKIFQNILGPVYLWILLITLSILATAGAAPGSIEGFIYTTFPLTYHLSYLPDIILQTGAFSFLIYLWGERKNFKASVPLFILFFIITGFLMFAMFYKLFIK